MACLGRLGVWWEGLGGGPTGHRENCFEVSNGMLQIIKEIRIRWQV